MPLLQPACIESHWQTILPGLRIVQRKAPAEWTPGQVFRACRSGQAFLFRAPEGFCILRPIASDSTVLHVWIVYGEGTGLIATYEPEIVRLAREIDATKLVFTSPRAGYRRVLRHWHRDGNDYTRYLT